MVSPFVIFKVVRITRASRIAGSSAVKPVAAYLVKRKLIKEATAPSVEGIAVALFDRRSVTLAEPTPLALVRVITGGPPAEPRGGALPTTDEAIDAFTEGVEAQKRIGGLEIDRRLPAITNALGRSGLTPFLPIVGRVVRRQVYLNLGVPKWLIVTGDIAVSLVTPI